MSAYEKGGWTRLHSLCFKRENYGRETFLWRAERLALKYGIDCRTNLGNTPLHFACSDPAFADLALFLISKGADPSLKNREGETPLHHACIHSTPAVVEALVRCPTVNVDVQDANECTPLQWTLQQSESPVGVTRALLLAGACVDCRDDSSDTALHYAAREGYFEIYELLRAAHRGEELYNNLGLSPFHAACETDQVEFVRKFIGKYPLEARRRTSASFSTGLHLAVQAQAFDTVEVLLASDVGQFQLESLDLDGKTPFALAYVLRLTDVMALLKRAGAHSDVEALKAELRPGRFPLFGDSDSDSSEDEWGTTDSWTAVTPDRTCSIACVTGSDLGKDSSSDGSEQCSLRYPFCYEEDCSLGWYCELDSGSCP